MVCRVLLLLAFSAVLYCVEPQGSDYFEYVNDPVPNIFRPNQRYPDRPETDECRPIRLRIARNSRRFRTELVTNTHSSIQFARADARIMSNRLYDRLNDLANNFYGEHGVWITVLKAWTEFGDSEVYDPTSLHFEGKAARM